MGIGGNTVRDLQARWQTDVLDLNPDWLTVMIGINDVWRRFDQPAIPESHVSLEEYEQTLEELVRSALPGLEGLVIMTPFYLEPNDQDRMRPDGRVRTGRQAGCGAGRRIVCGYAGGFRQPFRLRASDCAGVRPGASELDGASACARTAGGDRLRLVAHANGLLTSTALSCSVPTLYCGASRASASFISMEQVIRKMLAELGAKFLRNSRRSFIRLLVDPYVLIENVRR